jgi:hypothetical protein
MILSMRGGGLSGGGVRERERERERERGGIGEEKREEESWARSGEVGCRGRRMVD